jgi:hypothetical protein
MNEDKVFKSLTYLIVVTCIALLLTCSWQSYLHYLNRKLIIQSVQKNNTNLSIDQIQGLINSKQ